MKKTVPVNFSTLEMCFLGTDEQEELAIIPFFEDLHCRGCGVCLLCLHFATYTLTACLLFQGGTRKRFSFGKKFNFHTNIF